MPPSTPAVPAATSNTVTSPTTLSTQPPGETADITITISVFTLIQCQPVYQLVLLSVL